MSATKTGPVNTGSRHIPPRAGLTHVLVEVRESEQLVEVLLEVELAVVGARRVVKDGRRLLVGLRPAPVQVRRPHLVHANACGDKLRTCDRETDER